MNYDQKHADQTILYQILHVLSWSVKNGWICLAKHACNTKTNFDTITLSSKALKSRHFFFFFPQKMASYFIKETWYSIVSSMKHFTPEKVASKEMERWQEQRETLLKSESYCGLQGSFHTMSPLICVSEVSLYICLVCQLIAFKLLGYS